MWLFLAPLIRPPKGGRVGLFQREEIFFHLFINITLHNEKCVLVVSTSVRISRNVLQEHLTERMPR
jgi:hypothetical protein